MTPPMPPSADASRMQVLHELWSGAGLEAVETREIAVQRHFADFDEYWAIISIAAGVRPLLAAMAPGEIDQLKVGLRARLDHDAGGRITYRARANAVKGRVPT
jgi:hypothetical protein